ncbi:DUF2177 family protein [Glaciecola siphonariae]|uniref:DUF2177 family protein n=1 Tax=Glaciecola siphonariae TaxID=521012 RepID=A0ABV9LZ92_9ALTE
MNKLKPLGITYLSILVTYLIADFIWLGIIAKADYSNSIGHLMRDSYPMWPWIAFYLIYSACILRLAIFNGAKPTFARVFANAFILGLASYGAYNLTNYAILADWPLSITFKDWIWGTSITTASALVGFFALSFATRRLEKAQSAV